MSASLLSLLLYIPVLALAVLIGIAYLREGYKKGLWRSLVSLGATVCSLLISMLLAKIASKLLAGLVYGILPIDANKNDVFYSFASDFIKGMIQVALSLFFFVLVFFIALIVLKAIGRKLNIEKLDTEEKGLKWAGLGVRFVDTVLVVLLLFLPIYGALATYIPPVKELYGIKNREAESEPVGEYLNAIDGNAVVSVYKAGPMAWVFDGLSSFGVKGESINLSKIAEVISGIIERFSLISKGDEQDRIDAIKELNDYIKENVVEEKWSYRIICAVSKSMEEYVDTVDDEALKNELKNFIVLFDMSEEEYKTNGLALLDFTSFALESEFIEFTRTKDYTIFTDEYYAKFGDLINSSKQAVALKRIILEDSAVSLYYNYVNDYGYVEPMGETAVSVSGGAFVENETDAKAAAKDYIDKYYGDGFVDKADRVKEGMAFTLIMFNEGKLDLIEGFARHPLFGLDSVDKFVDEQFLEYNKEYFFNEEELHAFCEAHPELLDLLKEKLAECAEARLGEMKFEDYFDALMSTVYFTNGISLEYYLTFDGKTLKTILELYGEQGFVDSSLSSGKEAYEFLYALADVIDTFEREEGEYFSPETTDFGCLYAIIDAAKNTERWPDAVFSDSYGYNEGEQQDVDAYYMFTHYVRRVLMDDVLCETAHKIVEEKGRDPWGLGANLSDREKQTFKTIVDNSYSGLYISGGGEISGEYFISVNGERFEENAQKYNEKILLNGNSLKALFGID